MRLLQHSWPVFAAMAALPACGGTETPRPTGDGGCVAVTMGDRDATRRPADCHVAVASHTIEGNQHMPVCSPLTYATNPPSSGDHYGVWAAYQTYGVAFPRGFWVHSLEHGAVVMTYNCPDGCQDDVAAAQALIDSLPDDCGTGQGRLILTPDPALDVRFAASAWGFTLRADCFDRDAFASFIAEHYDHAPESICGGGVDPTGGCSEPICP